MRSRCGVSITFPQKRGTNIRNGGMTSPDGQRRAFDAGAQGTVFGSGVGVVLLKQVQDFFLRFAMATTVHS